MIVGAYRYGVTYRIQLWLGINVVAIPPYCIAVLLCGLIYQTTYLSVCGSGCTAWVIQVNIYHLTGGESHYYRKVRLHNDPSLWEF